MTICNPKTCKKYSVEFIVVLKENLTPLLGAEVIQQINLELQEKHFEKAAAVMTTASATRKPKQPRKSLKNTVMCLRVI